MPHVASYASPDAENAWASSCSSSASKVLVMEDDDDLRYLIDLSLSMAGYDVVCVRDGQAAVQAYELAQSQGLPFGAVILDLQIKGGMGGQETIAYLCERQPDVKAIVCSTDAQDPVMQAPEVYGFVAKLDKPFRRADLLALLQRLMTTPSTPAFVIN